MTAKTEKAVNYTPEQAETIKTEYLANPSKDTVEKLANMLGKNTRSIVAKLVNMNVYQKQEYKTKTGEPVVKKDETADAIGKILGLSENDTSSLAKANKIALKAIFSALANSKPI